MRNFKKRLSDIISYIILSIIIIIAGAIILPNINLLYKIQPGFHFEKYKTAKEAKEALLELHPIGSDVGELVKTLEGAGAMVVEKDLTNAHKFKEYDEWWQNGVVKMYNFEYNKASPFFIILNYLKLNGGLQIDKNNKIIDFGIFRNRAY